MQARSPARLNKRVIALSLTLPGPHPGLENADVASLHPHGPTCNTPAQLCSWLTSSRRTVTVFGCHLDWFW